MLAQDLFECAKVKVQPALHGSGARRIAWSAISASGPHQRYPRVCIQAATAAAMAMTRDEFLVEKRVMGEEFTATIKQAKDEVNRTIIKQTGAVSISVTLY